MALGLFRQRIWLALFLASALCVLRGEAVAAPKLRPEVTDARQALHAGEDFERTRRWIDAIEHYEASIKKWPDDRAKATTSPIETTAMINAYSTT